ncbi:dihydrolipoamide acetyltransferase family protein [Albibacterium bauzanense]|uniref:Dihydrolipoamide acetyltransferase component of pyruvate dehydrogenase complex n=1 Tax=Albibacterium bauzanense TaxID=653929 RepID=A0A4R1M1V7_9SPHI|nr:dihydrolipoamide acetyltransferase family protein [Albibacterium bauzanense]TCK84980.1 2-oxoglutarate dehydrogenase E2 component (dihydrolipoamide succinyltransferase) [Albibacterium bauzanense]
MAKYNLLLPRMGESVSEATVVKWLKQPGDSIEIDDSVLDIATDKVDSEVPSPIAGTLVEQLFKENEIAQVGEAIAILEVNEEDLEQEPEIPSKEPFVSKPAEDKVETHTSIPIPGIDLLANESKETIIDSSNRFYSPLVKNIAAEEGISLEELDKIKGSGLEGRVTKQDVLDFVAFKTGNTPPATKPSSSESISTNTEPAPQAQPVSISEGDEIIEMDRMRKLIAGHMLTSVQTSPHVCSFIEADVTNIVHWRDRVKNAFEKQEGTKITFTPIFIEAIAKAIRDYPMINISVNGSQIIKKRDINIGMATALPSGNLIVPVIRNADQLNLVGITKVVNDMAARARINKLKPDETQGGTFTVTNVGSFGTVMGTPIINQPQVAILALGAIIKKPAVLETEQGDVIAIRQRMFLSLSYDHRVVDGALGGKFLKRIAEYLENWDVKRES